MSESELKIPDWQERPTEDERGKWHALDANGLGHKLYYDSQELVRAWMDGYESAKNEANRVWS